MTAEGGATVAPAPATTPDGLALRAYCWTVTALTGVVALVVVRVGSPGPAHSTAALVALVALAAGCTAVAVASGRGLGDGGASDGRPLWDVTWLWLFCAALVLPVGETVLLSLVLLLDVGLVARRPWHRASLYWASSVLALLLGRVVAGDLTALHAGRVVLAVGTTLVVQLGLVGVALVVESWAWRWPTELVSRDGVLTELVCLTVAALLATTLRTDPVVVLLAVPVVLLVQGSFQLPCLRRDARKDSKTGLDTDARWRERAGAGLAELQRAGRAASVLLLDVDRFKAVNDSAGHLAGDAVLAAVAGAVTGQLRDGDVIGRFGGDEFVALLRGVGAVRAHEVGERMRRAVGDLTVHAVGVDGSPVHLDTVTISVGVADTDGCGHDLEQLVLAADGALLAAKRAGRNRVHTA